MFFIGVDLGQKQDFSAWAVVEPVGDTLWVRYLERAQLGTPYSVVVDRVARLAGGIWLARNSRIVVDATGVGAPVVEMLRRAGTGSTVTTVTITGGEKAHGTGETWNVPKKDLLGGLQVLLEQGRLMIHRKLKEAPVLARELASIRQWTLAGGRLGMGALGCWRAQRRTIGFGTQRLL